MQKTRTSPPASSGSAGQVPFYRNAKVLPYIWQGVVLLAVIAGAVLLLLNLRRGMEAQGLSTSFEFLRRPAGFRISEGLTFSPQDSYLKAFMIGLFNTFRATILGILLASLLGLIVGTARLSNNWLVNRLAFGYIELVRNTPLLVQLVFWYFAVVLQLPSVRDAIKFGPNIYLSQRGLVLPGIEAPTVFWAACLGGIVAALLLGSFLGRLQRRSGRRTFAPFVALAAGAALVAVGYYSSGKAVRLDMPVVGTFRVTGGVSLSPEFAALLAALVFYFGGFIAEVIRGGITAVPKGQWEAARALGLGYLTTLRIIILPQAMRVIVPPLGNIYLNLTKASSLAVAVGYPDLFGLSATIGSQSGNSVQVMLMVMLTYLALTLVIAAGVNLLNRRVQIRTR
ncbi:MAG TPA: ABC transporter permease subunit [Trueperaceae bacterium]